MNYRDEQIKYGWLDPLLDAELYARHTGQRLAFSGVDILNWIKEQQHEKQ